MNVSCLCPSFDCSKWPGCYQTGQPVLGGYEKTPEPDGLSQIHSRHTVICSRYKSFSLCIVLDYLLEEPRLPFPVSARDTENFKNILFKKKTHNFPPSRTEISLLSSRYCIILHFIPSEVHSCSWYEPRTQAPFSNEQPRYHVVSTAPCQNQVMAPICTRPSHTILTLMLHSNPWIPADYVPHPLFSTF